MPDHILAKIKKNLLKNKASLSLKNDFMIINIKNTALTQGLKRILYFILNNYEKKYFILIKNTPFCFLKDACDHILYSKTKNSSYTKPAQCKVCKFTAICPGVPKNQTVFSTEPILDAPSDIAIELNKNCNSQCKFCHYKTNVNQHNLSFNKIKAVLLEAKGLNIRYIRFTGGEPLLRTDILKILDYAKSKGFYIFLNTNATLLDNSIIKSLEKYVDNILISLCGYDINSESSINAKSEFFKKKICNIAKIVRSRIPHIRVGTVISKLLIANFDKYSALISRIGIKTWELYRPMLKPTITKQYEDYNITKDDLLKLIKKIYKLRKIGIDVYIANALPFCITSKNSYKTLMRGAQHDDGHSRLVLDSKGFFKPSYFIDRNLGTTIKESWHHPFLRKINRYKYLDNHCRNCKYLNWCLGGSRYMAKEYSGNYFNRDPLIKI